jgi:hypothetical protein
MTDKSNLPTTRRFLLLSGAALAGLAALPLVPAALDGGFATIGSAFARNGADDGPDDDGHHTGQDDSGHHGGGDDDNDDGDDDSDDDGDDDDHGDDDDQDDDVSDDNSGDHRGRTHHKHGRDKHHGPNHT